MMRLGKVTASTLLVVCLAEVGSYTHKKCQRLPGNELEQEQLALLQVATQIKPGAKQEPRSNRKYQASDKASRFTPRYGLPGGRSLHPGLGGPADAPKFLAGASKAFAKIVQRSNPDTAITPQDYVRRAMQVNNEMFPDPAADPKVDNAIMNADHNPAAVVGYPAGSVAGKKFNKAWYYIQDQNSKGRANNITMREVKYLQNIYDQADKNPAALEALSHVLGVPNASLDKMALEAAVAYHPRDVEFAKPFKATEKNTTSGVVAEAIVADVKGHAQGLNDYDIAAMLHEPVPLNVTQPFPKEIEKMLKNYTHGFATPTRTGYFATAPQPQPPPPMPAEIPLPGECPTSEIHLTPGQGDDRYWRCIDGGCIQTAGRCDGAQNCLDGSDELYCNKALFARVNALDSKNAELQETILTIKNGATESSMAEFEAIDSMIQAINESLSSDFGSLKNSTSQHLEVQTDLEANSKKVADVKKRVEVLKARDAAQKQNVSSLVSKNSALKSSWQSLKKENQDLQKEVKSLKEDFTALAAQVRKNK